MCQVLHIKCNVILLSFVKNEELTCLAHEAPLFLDYLSCCTFLGGLYAC